MSFSLVPGFAQRYPKDDDNNPSAAPDERHSRLDLESGSGGTPSPIPDDRHTRPDRASLFIETCCTTLEQARSAESRGAGRIELCVDLSVGGVTPPRDLIRDVVASLTIPVNVLIRPDRHSRLDRESQTPDQVGAGGFSAADFVYDEVDLQQMIDDIGYCKSVGVAGIVVGALTPEGAIDLPAMRRLVAAARPLPVTFHRAFDVCTDDPFTALDKLIALGCSRLLSSGQAPTAWDGRNVLTLLVRRAGPRLIVMPGCGITPDNLPALASATRALEFHGTRIP
ncbi:MAG: copper homeostasis protein CutC [Bacteroidales bacterium]|nr:copper homeostasis protein CutC [Bacteroidales bacterium]